MKKVNGYIGIGIQGIKGKKGGNGLSTFFKNNSIDNNEEYIYVDSSMNKYLHTSNNDNIKINDNIITLPIYFNTSIPNIISTNKKMIIQRNIFSDEHQKKLLKENYYLTLLDSVNDKNDILSFIKNEDISLNIKNKENKFEIDNKLVINGTFFSNSPYNILFHFNDFFNYTNKKWKLTNPNKDYFTTLIKDNIKISIVSYIVKEFNGTINTPGAIRYPTIYKCEEYIDKNFGNNKLSSDVEKYLNELIVKLKEETPSYYNVKITRTFIKIEILLDNNNYTFMREA